MRRLLRDPLLHFAILGVLLFTVFRGLGGVEDGVRSPIRLRAGDLGLLEARWEQLRGRPPSAEELESLIEGRLREEILYREALSLGLDRDDAIVRRRLVQKMEFLAGNAAEASEPTNEELSAFLQRHPERFRVPGSVTFEQIYFSRDAHGEGLSQVAAHGLSAVRAGESVEGDPFLLARSQQRVTDDRVGQLFGKDFRAALLELPAKRWQGPIASSYGLHLVFVERSQPPRTPALQEVRDRVAREWEAARREEEAQAFYEGLRQRYPVEIEGR